MLDIGWPELLVLLIIALVVIGPKDLPKAMYTLGKWVRAIRRVTGQMQKQFDDAMREAELDDIKDKLKSANKYNIRKQVEGAIDPKGQLKKSFDLGEGKSVKQFLADGTAGPGADGGTVKDRESGGKAGAAGDGGEDIRQRKLASLGREVGDENADKVAVAGVQENPAPQTGAGSGAGSRKSAAKGSDVSTPSKTAPGAARTEPAASGKSGGGQPSTRTPAPASDEGGSEAVTAETAGKTSANSTAATPMASRTRKETVPGTSGGGE